MTYSTAPFSSATGRDRLVRDVMHPGRVSVPARAPLAEAAGAMARHGVHAILVCDDHDAPLGWVTARGMLHNLPRDWAKATAGDAITEPLISVAPTDTLNDALKAFLASGASHILVRASEGELVLGVVADSDLLGVLAGGDAVRAG